MFGWQAPALLGHPELLVPIKREIVTSPQASVDIFWEPDFDEVLFNVYNVVPANNDDELHGRTSADGVSFDIGATDYHLQSNAYQSGVAVNRTTGAGAPYLVMIATANLNHGIENVANEGASAFFTMPYPFEARETEIYGWGGYNAASTQKGWLCFSGGYRQATTKTVGFQFYFGSGGNIAGGVFEAWGLLPVERA